MNATAIGGRGSPAIGAVEAARLLALLVPLALLGGALAFQYIGGLAPCEMCYWQRWPHAAAILFAIAALTAPATSRRSRVSVLLAAAAIALSGVIGVFHAGVEMGWWEGFTSCAATGAVTLQDIMSAPIVRCDQVQWALLGISMAGWNAILSLGSAILIAFLTLKGRMA